MNSSILDELTPYLRALFLLRVQSLGLSGSAKKHAELFSEVHNVLLKSFNGYDVPAEYDYKNLAKQLLEELIAADVIQVEKVRFAGEYYTYINPRYPVFRASALKANAIADLATRIGDRFFPDVFSGYSQELSQLERSGVQDPQQEIAVPVSLSEEKRVSLVREINVVEASLDAKDLTNSEKSQARAFLNAAKDLTEAPDPPADLIWEILSRANAMAGIASLFVSIIAIFMAK